MWKFLIGSVILLFLLTLLWIFIMLNQEQTQFLLTLLNLRFTEISAHRQLYKLEISTPVSRHLDDDLNQALSSCLHLKALFSVVTIDDSFVSGMLPKDFDMLQSFMSNHIRHLNKQINALSKIDPVFSDTMKPSFDERIAFVQSIQNDLNSMLGPTIATA